jgi:FMN-dependent NADH-azoreductase
MSLLKIVASARSEGSLSRLITDELVVALRPRAVITRDLAQDGFPVMTAEDLMAMFANTDDARASLQSHLETSALLIEELMAAETLVLGTPMYNFGVPVVVKQWIDYICRHGKTFQYTRTGPEGLTKLKQVYLVTASGGENDFASRYLEQVLRFIGAQNVQHIAVSGSKGRPEMVLADARAQIKALLQ